MAEVVGEKKVNLQTNIYVNNDTRSVQTRAAADNIPEYAAKYVDANNIIHPAAVLLTDPYGYDKDGWVLFKYPFDPEKDEAIHESPAEKKEAELVKTQMPKFLEVLAVIQQKNPSYYTEYVYLLNMMMTMKRWSHEQAEEEFLKQLIKDMPYFETTSTENMLTLMAGVQPRILKFYQDLEPKYKAFMGEQSWKEVQATLQGSPALEKYNNYFYRNFARRYFRSLIRNFSLREKIGCISEKSK